MIPQNVGETDRALRIFIGFAFIFVGILAKSWLTIVGVLLALTGIIGYSLLYSVLKFSTTPKPILKKNKKSLRKSH